jgi:COP9 signalosome complex subunit 1
MTTQLIAPGDIALYGTLCTLATLSRSSVQHRILQSATFTTYLASSPVAHSLATTYLSSQFATLLATLESYLVAAALDIHLAGHFKALEALVKDKAVCLYFKPFGAVRMESMGKALGWDVETVEREVVRLIQKGDIEGRVDSQNKVGFILL